MNVTCKHWYEVRNSLSKSTQAQARVQASVPIQVWKTLNPFEEAENASFITLLSGSPISLPTTMFYGASPRIFASCSTGFSSVRLTDTEDEDTASKVFQGDNAGTAEERVCT